MLASSSAFSQAYYKYFNDGKKLFAEEKYDEAIAEFDKTIAEKENHHEAWNYKGLCLEGKGDLKAAIDPLKQETVHREKEGKYHADLGSVYYNLKMYNEAV